MSEVNATPEIPQSNTIYINNLNEKIKIDELKKSLNAVFTQFGKILEVLAFKTLKHKGQAWVVFEDASSASNALRQMQELVLLEKLSLIFPFIQRIQYAKTKSDIIAKADGTFVPREKRKRHDDKAKKRKDQHDANLAGMGLNPAYAGAYGAAPAIAYPGGAKSMVPEAPAPPNNILFIQNLPNDSTPMMLQMLFLQYPGFKEVRMVETKPGIAFVEYGDEMQSTVAMQTLQGFKITPQNPMLITYAKK
ncbi:hypothetical protein JHK85_008745 [Glycine max]|nr:hypothetical protein JHK85_008745 [Glycine max]KAG5073304.1 hypothetical protein JHK86_008515 [Glycine max]